MNIVFLAEPHPDVLTATRLFRARGHDVLTTDCTSLAQAYTRLNPPDLVIASLFPKGTAEVTENGLSVAMSAQFHNPDVVTILLSDSAVFGQGELFAMLSSLRCVLAQRFKISDLVETAQYFLESGPVDCAPKAGGPDLCNRCLMSGLCDHAGAPSGRVAVAAA